MMTGCKRSIPSYPTIPTNLLESCEKLNQLGGKSGKDFMLWATDTIGKYENCKLKHDKLIESASVVNGYSLEKNKK